MQGEIRQAAQMEMSAVGRADPSITAPKVLVVVTRRLCQAAAQASHPMEVLKTFVGSKITLLFTAGTAWVSERPTLSHDFSSSLLTLLISKLLAHSQQHTQSALSQRLPWVSHPAPAGRKNSNKTPKHHQHSMKTEVTGGLNLSCSCP